MSAARCDMAAVQDEEDGTGSDAHSSGERQRFGRFSTIRCQQMLRMAAMRLEDVASTFYADSSPISGRSAARSSSESPGPQNVTERA
jgi:hypothetical protein